jgi:class 3 adenylate cyclase/tetratricopeptide (TPR) repeat protein
MHCPRCQEENPSQARFCMACGAGLSVPCGKCGAELPGEARFCFSCGQPVSAAPASRFGDPTAYTPKHLVEKILTSKSALEGERKQVTVLFTDVSGFTALSERLDPEDIHAIMDRAFEAILAAVHRSEGTVNQFLGDGVMALFGAPIAHEDHAHRALRAALAIQEGLQPLRADVQRTYGQDFLVRTGINTGLVVVGAIGRDLRMDYTAVGDTTNLAARLLSHAAPGQILVSRYTQHLREGFFVFEDVGEFQVKGKTRPIHAYALKSEIRGRTRLEVSKMRGLTPLAGRKAEHQRLAAGFGRASKGAGGIVLVSGQPGVGKSRLLYEFLRSLDDTATVGLETTCLPYGRSMPYHPILELLRRYLGLADRMSVASLSARIREQLAALGIEGDEPAELLGHFLGVPVASDFLGRLGGAQLKERTHAVLSETFLRASETKPLVLVVENIHWIDPSSEEFLGSLATALRRHRIFLVLTARPAAAQPWLPATTERIALEGLDAEDIREMALALLGVREVSTPLRQALLAKADGNPLYVEEIVHQLQETGGIVISDGEAQLQAANVTVPATVHDIIAARVDRLAQSLKQTLQPAAVVGRQFAVPLLARLVDAPGDLENRLDNLHALDFVFPGVYEPQLTYRFKHALTQEVVYASLLERRRRQFHAAVGAALEEFYAGRTDDIVELLAHHFQRSAEDEKAVDYALQAADKAQRRWANTEALAHFDAALRRLGSMPDTEGNRLRRIDAVVKQAEVKFALGRHAEHIQALEGIQEIVEADADPPRRAAWYYWMGFLHSLTGSPPEAPIAYCRHASAIAEANGLEEVGAFALCCLTHVNVVAGNLQEAVTAGERALGIFERRGNLWWACRTLWTLSMAYNAIGAWESSLACCRRGLDYGIAMDDRRLKAVGWFRTGATHIQRGDPRAGIESCDEALTLSPAPFDAAMIRAMRAFGQAKAGERSAGIAHLEEAIAWFGQSNLGYTRSVFALLLAESYLYQGDRAKARPLVAEVLTDSREAGYRHLEGVATRLLGELLSAEDSVMATQHLDSAARLLEVIGARNELAKTLVATAELERSQGDQADARRLYGRALEIFDALGTLDGAARVRAALATLEAR